MAPGARKHEQQAAITRQEQLDLEGAVISQSPRRFAVLVAVLVLVFGGG